MNEDNTKKLFNDFPKMFPKEQRKDPRQSLMAFGFSCDNGWFWLIHNLCETIQSYINDNGKRVKQIEVAQVKEKFGGLRFYINGGEELINGMIWFAEHLSYKICERCGLKGELRSGGWYVTLCDKCHVEKVKK